MINKKRCLEILHDHDLSSLKKNPGFFININGLQLWSFAREVSLCSILERRSSCEQYERRPLIGWKRMDPCVSFQDDVVKFLIM
ncbi:hypothetical protein CEXT_544601 [Caerostris extrusa]|uniref:Uncharacterized protein n=1 Tax=Caerostris extrusa TaxID=172846 RepID=A0AAV4P2A0_CAEEX|nr:hypothetical protein CEXT_544601 [Caerostris extrusa]